MKTTWRVPAALLLLPVAIALPLAALAGEFSIPWYSIDAGGGRSTAAPDTDVVSVIGQPDAGILTGAGYTLSGGFLPLPAGEVIFGDCDGDGDVDLFDYRALQACFTGPKEAPDFPGMDPGCECYDLQEDGDVDLIDGLLFQLAFTG